MAGQPEGGEEAAGPEAARSPLHEALALIAALLSGPRRFNDLLADLPGIAPNVLTQRLRALERSTLVVARPYSERPPRSAYELSAAGRELSGALALLAEWGARHAGGGEAPVHAPCGTPLEARWYCATCERAVDEEEAAGDAFI